MLTSTSRWYALAAMALSTLAVGLDTTVLSVALPTLARDLEASTGELQWFTTAYLLVLAAALLPAGLLGDRLGRKRMLIGALVLFGVASVACAYASSAGLLIAARAVLGLGAAVIMPLSGAVLTTLFDSSERARAMSIWVTASALGIPLGPLLGGWLLDHFWWGSVFLINVPVVIAGVLALAIWLPSSRGVSSRLDVGGVALSTAGLVALTYGIIEAGSSWGPRALIAVGAGVVLLAAFVLRQRRAASPLVDLALFRNRAFTGGAVFATIASFAMLGLLFSLPQLFSAVGGHDAFGSGLRLLPVIGGLILGARVGEKLAGGLGARVVIAGGLGLIAVASLLGAQTTATTGYGYIAVWITLTGIGLGLTMPPALNAAIGALTPARAGIGNALLQALRQVGGAVGVAVLGAVLNSAYRSHLAAAPAVVREGVTPGVAFAAQTGDGALGASVRAAFAYGMDRSLLVAGALALVGAVLALFVMPARPAGEQSEVLAESLV
ncbi:DHA2 family efflux MFS transporter permease subunit [Actinoplanes bogorensis]|uniref:DHA2 family efflux MFS transporter permease subunit n=1 Tax=Paractinoplanes bogorensis TaxID=1610840 RepID=A0ABS5Z610_9ACTN|nr:DHA2 family efflux MFS transporter permease subunit [Actinoplanes bogorensis]MBU2670996.1 DHA2 family efflux MFS transporter permease subunit [Actinoplanes bogorensis]